LVDRFLTLQGGNPEAVDDEQVCALTFDDGAEKRILRKTSTMPVSSTG
jgi:hypothetical protein